MFCFFSGHYDHCSCAVVQAGGIPGGNSAAFYKAWTETGQFLQRLALSWTFVCIKDRNVSFAVGALVGFVNGGIVAMFNVPAFIVTLATMNIAKGIAYIYTGGQSTRITDDAFAMLGTGYLFGIIPLPVVYMTILVIVFIVLLGKTKFGTYVYALGGNRESARLSGVPIKKIEVLVFTISGLLSAFAGIVLASRMYSGQPTAGDGYEMDAIAACVLGGVSMSGGVGRISGTVFGAIVIGVISNGLNLMGVSSFWQLVVKGIIILAAIILDSRKDMISAKFKKK